VARLPITGSDVFGREEDVAFLDDAWVNEQVNIATIVAWAGVGKSALVNHWLGRMAANHYRSAEVVFGWSFYRQGTGGGSSSANEFIDSALAWFGDPDPRIGTAWEKGERLAKLISHRRTLLILDGLEPQQNPPGPREGRLRDPSLQALLRELAAFNTGLCVITTRLPVSDVADHEGASVLRRELEQLCSNVGAKLLRALGVKGHEAELRSASDEFGGHCLALTLLGSYLADAYNGDIRRRKEVSERLASDVRQGFHARKAMESYQNWFGEGPELSVLRILGLFDRPADEKALEAILTPPAIGGLTESLVGLSQTEWRMILAKLRRARLLAREDPHNPVQLDTHPLVREYFGEQLQSQRADAWKECNLRLYQYYRSVAPPLPETFTEMEPLFLAVICGCNAGLYREALHEVYIPRIQRGNASFAANVLGARAAVLSVLVHFFERGRWGSPVQAGREGQGLTAEDQLFILMQAAVNITAMRESAPEAKLCYERAEVLCHSLNRPRLLYVTLIGQHRYYVIADKMSVAFEIEKRLYELAQEQNEPALMIGACTAVAAGHYHAGDFATTREYTTRGLQIWRSAGEPSAFEEVDSQPVACLAYQALIEWHFGEIPACDATIAEAISLAKELNDMHGLAVALSYGAILGYFESNSTEVEYLASTLIELSTRYNFLHWLAIGAVCRGWARSARGATAEGLARIEEGIEDYRATGSIAWVPYFLALKAEALHLAGRTSEALEAIREAGAMIERFEGHWMSAELHRLRGVLLAAIGADEAQIENSFRTAIETAKGQKSLSLEKRAEASYAEYRRRKEQR
jgi:predicted ATPase